MNSAVLSLNACLPTFSFVDTHPKIPSGMARSVEKSNAESPNTAKVQVWNLSDKNLKILDTKDCALELKAGYEDGPCNLYNLVLDCPSVAAASSYLLQGVLRFSYIADMEGDWLCTAQLLVIRAQPKLDKKAVTSGGDSGSGSGIRPELLSRR